MPTLVTGASGTLGRAFAALLPDALTPSSAEMDVRSEARVLEYVSDNRVDRVIHCAALTSLRECEEHPWEAYRTNVLGTKNLCDALSFCASEPYLVYISTACVFDGHDLDAVYVETDVARPTNYYGLSKLLAEHVIQGWSRATAGPRGLVARTNFAERGRWKYPAAFTDRFGTYLYPDQVAARVHALMAEGMTGIVHVCGERRLSMFEFARLADASVLETTMGEYDGPPLTVNMSLGSERIAPLSLP